MKQDNKSSQLYRAIVYARVSSTKQLEGVSIESQIRKARAYADIHEMEIVAEYSDDFTGYTISRPQFEVVMEDLRHGKANALITLDNDRISRDSTDYAILRKELQTLGVDLHYVTRGKIDLDSFGHQVVEDIQGRFAQNWGTQIKKDTMRGRYEKVEQGGVMLKSNRIFGYDVIREGKLQKLQINENQAQVVRMVFEWYTRGDETDTKLTVRQITHKLNRMGIKPPNNRKYADEWRHGAIDRMLTQTTYVGIYTYAHLSNRQPAIVDNETWDLAQERKRLNTQGVNRNKSEKVLLRYRCTCGECGYVINAPTATQIRRGKLFKYTYYICPMSVSHRQDGRTRTCHSRPRVKAKTLDDRVWEEIEPLIFDDKKLDQIFEERQSGISHKKQEIQARLDLVQQTLDEREKDFAELADAYKLAKNDRLRAKLDNDADGLDQQIKGLRRRRKQIKAELAAEEMNHQDLLDLKKWLKEVRGYAERLQNDIDAKIWILDAIQLKGTISVVDGKKVAKFRGLLGNFSVSCTGEHDGGNR
jgi:site-specific DNA recombinase